VDGVEVLCVPAVQAVHSTLQALAARLDDEVVVVRHQAAGVHRPPPPSRHFLQEAQEDEPVVDREVDVAPPDAARRDVEDAGRASNAPLP
jgi:hypothetical protein